MIQSLEVFVSVVEKKNFSRAADKHHLSQPGVSLIIRQLEEQFHAQLLHRSPKHVELTRAGEILYRHALEIIRHWEEAKEEIHLLNDVVAGSIKIGASFTIGEYLVPGILARFAGKYPTVESQVLIGNTEEVAEWVKNGEIDIGLVEGEVENYDLAIIPFMEDEMIIILPGGHPYQGENEVKPEKLRNQVWILREQGSGTRTYGDKFIKDYHLNPSQIYEFSSNQGVKEAVIAGLGISVISRLTVRKELKSGELTTLEINGEKNTRMLSLVQLKREKPTRVLEAFSIEVRNYVKPIKSGPMGTK